MCGHCWGTEVISFMKQVDQDIDSLRADVFELKTSLMRADRIHGDRREAGRLSVLANLSLTMLLGLFFLLL